MERNIMKQRIRNEIKKLRKALSASQREEWNEAVFHKLIHSEELKGTDTIYTYVSMEQETDTRRFILHSLNAGKRIAVPRVEGEFMRFYYITSFSELRAGCMGILEPEEDLSPADAALDMEEGAAFFLPGLAFDREGGRIGYGGGFYDRFLAEYPGFKKTALAFQYQVMESVPSEALDIKVNRIVTEKEDIYVGKERD